MSVNNVMIVAAPVHKVRRAMPTLATPVGHFAAKTNVYGQNKNK